MGGLLGKRISGLADESESFQFLQTVKKEASMSTFLAALSLISQPASNKDKV